MKKHIISLFSICLYCTFSVLAQQKITISGRVTDAQTGDPVPFASVAVKGKTIGTTTNFEGFYTLNLTQNADSLVALSMGYKSRAKALGVNIPTQTIDFQLEASSIKLQEVKIYAGENPAYPIMRKVLAQKKVNDPNRLKAYEYESYNKIEVDVDNLSEKFKKRRAIKKITSAIEKFEKIAGEDGRPVIPIYLSEAISHYYYQTDPIKRKEIILKTKLSGVGLNQNSAVSQLMGASYQQYNFYRNWLNIANKDFISPIADGWKVTYEYYLTDTTFVGGYWCYQIDFEPKREQDQAFAGTIWVDTLTHALVQIDATVGKNAHINFIEKIKIQQEYDQAGDSAWLPSKSRVMIDVAELTDSTAGMLVKFYNSNRNFVVNKPKPAKFYDTEVELAEDYLDHAPDYWEKARHEPLAATDKLAYKLIDSVKNVPVVRSYLEVLNIVIYGYKRIPKVNIDVGPYLYAYSNNVLEGNRFQLGVKTNPDFSRKWTLSGYLAYGTLDQKFKYRVGADYIFTKKPWTIAGISHGYDLERLGLSPESIGNNNLFGAFTHWGNIRRGFFQTDNALYFKRELLKGFTQTVGVRQRDFLPMYSFAYKTNPEDGDNSTIRSTYQTAELYFETRWGRDEVFIFSDNERLTLGTQRWPLVIFRYSAGLKGFLNSDFSYHKFSLNVRQSVRTGQLGRSYYSLTLGYIPSTLPYPMLYTPLGNQSSFYVISAFNLMNYFEFVSDQYAQLQFEHNFEGLFFNRIPLIRKLKWKTSATAKLLYGSVRPENVNIISPLDMNGNAVLGFQSLSKMPYIEVGYGIGNIFKVLRIDAIHRLTYRQNPGVSKFGVKFAFEFSI